jgi:predicted DNA-binding protein YlxM (UPF0122 family)
MGRYSNHANQGELFARLLDSVPEAPVGVKMRTTRQVLHRRLRDDQIQDLVGGYEDGLTVYQLADHFRIHRDTVSKVLKRQNVTMRHRGLVPHQVEEATLLYGTGLSIARIAEILDLNRTTVYNALRVAAVENRPG